MASEVAGGVSPAGLSGRRRRLDAITLRQPRLPPFRGATLPTKRHARVAPTEQGTDGERKARRHPRTRHRMRTDQHDANTCQRRHVPRALCWGPQVARVVCGMFVTSICGASYLKQKYAPCTKFDQPNMFQRASLVEHNGTSPADPGWAHSDLFCHHCAKWLVFSKALCCCVGMVLAMAPSFVCDLARVSAWTGAPLCVGLEATGAQLDQDIYHPSSCPLCCLQKKEGLIGSGH